MTEACEALAAFSSPHGIRRSRLFAYAQRLPLDDERLVRLAEAGDGLRACEDPTYHALRWPDSDPAAGMEALVREAERLQPYWAGMFRPRPPKRPRSRKRRPRRRIRFHTLDGSPVTLTIPPNRTDAHLRDNIIWGDAAAVT
jgi:hypothetical protein